MNQILETTTNIIAEGTRLEGKIVLEKISRVHGTLIGEIVAPKGSHLVIAESAIVEGNVQADTLIIDGFIKGDITATTKIQISDAGRVIGTIRTPLLSIDYGAYFEGRAFTNSDQPLKMPAADSAI